MTARVLGAAILALGVAGLRARDDLQGRAGLAIADGLTGYNLLAAVLLIWAGAGLRLGGPILWAGAIGHALLGILLVRTRLAPRRR